MTPPSAWSEVTFVCAEQTQGVEGDADPPSETPEVPPSVGGIAHRVMPVTQVWVQYPVICPAPATQLHWVAVAEMLQTAPMGSVGAKGAFTHAAKSGSQVEPVGHWLFSTQPAWHQPAPSSLTGIGGVGRPIR